MSWTKNSRSHSTQPSVLCCSFKHRVMNVRVSHQKEKEHERMIMQTAGKFTIEDLPLTLPLLKLKAVVIYPKRCIAMNPWKITSIIIPSHKRKHKSTRRNQIWALDHIDIILHYCSHKNFAWKKWMNQLPIETTLKDVIFKQEQVG